MASVSRPRAETWSDLRALLDSGVPLESALGLDKCAEGMVAPQDCTKIKIGGQEERFEYRLPSADDIKLLGLTDPEESLTVFPPFIDLSKFLQPLYVPEPGTDSRSHTGEYLKLPNEFIPGDVKQEDIKQEKQSAHSQKWSSEDRKRSREESISPQAVSCKKTRGSSSSPVLLDSSSSGDSVVFVDLTQDR